MERQGLGVLWDDRFGAIAAYAVMVPLLIHRYPFGLDNASAWKPVMVVYNALMSLFSLVSFVGMTYVVFVKHGGRYGSASCTAIAEDSDYVRLVEAFYLSKYVEFADTLFLVVKGKQVSWLHYVHHIGISFGMGISFHAGTEATWISVLLNGFIHTFMYAFYMACLLGFRPKGKMVLTVMQIAQFFVGLRIMWDYKSVPCFREDPASMAVFVYTYAYVSLVIVFFCNFFLQSYLFGRPSLAMKKAA